MPLIGAAAHALPHGSREIRAKGQGHHLLDQPRAGSARGRSLGHGPHRGKGLRTRLDRLYDPPFAHAVAAANLRLRRQGCNGRHRVRCGPPLVAWAEDQGVAQGADIGAVLDQPEEPRPVCGIAVKHRTDQPVLLDHQPFVDAARGVAQDNIFTPLAFGESPALNRSQPVTFSLVAVCTGRKAAGLP